MRFNTPSISDHRLKRLHRWALLWLKWFAAFLDVASAHMPLSTQAKLVAHAWLDQIEQAVVSIVMIRAARGVRRRNSRSYLFARRKFAGRRAIIGSRLRRVLRSRDLHRRIEALSLNIVTLVARLLKRLPCGLTRASVTTRPEADVVELFVLGFGPALPMDSS